MAYSPRVASQFFAAFYRWKCYSHQSRICSRFISRNHRPIRYPPALHRSRGYHQEYTQLQTTAAEEHPTAEISHDAPELIENNPTTDLRQKLSPQRPGSNTEEGQDTALSEYSEQENLKPAVRTLMRKVPNSIAVITAFTVEPGDIRPQPLGVVVSSLTSVSLDPPTISFNIKEPSKTLKSIRSANGLFRVHFLEAKKKRSATIADQFTHGNHPKAYEVRRQTLKIYSPSDSSDPRATPSLAPQICERSVVAAMECKVTQEVPVADHIIVVAKVNSMNSKPTLEPTLMYRDGTYIHDHHTPFLKSSSSTNSPQLEAITSWPIFDYPLFPGERDRQDLLNRLKSHINENPKYLQVPIPQASKALEMDIGLRDGSFGISLRAVIGECKSNVDAQRGAAATIWGRLTPSQVETIVHRVRSLVQKNPKTLSLDFRILYKRIGLSVLSTGILASDIIGPLRVEGLVGPFSPKGRFGHSTLEAVEQIEHNLIQHLQTLKYHDAINYPAAELMEIINKKSPWVKSYIKQIRSRLHVEATPELFSSSRMDISGELTQEEARVVVARLSKYFRGSCLEDVREHLRTPRVEILRRIGVHPMVSGIDPDYFFGKMGYLYNSTRSYLGLRGWVDKMLKPWFDRKVTWEELEERVKQFAQRAPLRATSWVGGDRLAAMGLDYRATVKDPSWDNRTEELSSSHTIDILLAKELKSFYGKGTERENEAIADFFKRKYGYETDSSDTTGDDLHDVIIRNLKLGIIKGGEAENLLKEERYGTFLKMREDAEWSIMERNEQEDTRATSNGQL